MFKGGKMYLKKAYWP